MGAVQHLYVLHVDAFSQQFQNSATLHGVHLHVLMRGREAVSRGTSLQHGEVHWLKIYILQYDMA